MVSPNARGLAFHMASGIARESAWLRGSPWHLS